MTRLQREDLKAQLILRYKPGEYHPIPEVMFSLVRRGLSLRKARELFLEVARKNGWSLVPSSVPMIVFGNVEGKRGEERILKWYIKDGTYMTHFVVLRGVSRKE